MMCLTIGIPFTGLVVALQGTPVSENESESAKKITESEGEDGQTRVSAILVSEN